MKLSTEKIGDVIVVTVLTEVLDASNAEEFKIATAPILEKNNKVVFEISQIKFMDSSGCGTLLSYLRQLKSSNGNLKLCGVQEPIRMLFELVRINRIIEIFDTKEEAVKSF